VIKLFDYIFYRIYKFYTGQGNKLADSFASSLLTVMQCFTIIGIMVMVKIVRDYTFPDKLLFVLFFVIIGGLNWYRYEHKIDLQRLVSQWKDEDQSKKAKKGWLIVIYLIVALSIPIVYGYLHVNAKLI
jgi:hypothetical protein